MLSLQHFKLLPAATVVASLLVFLGATYKVGETHAAAGTLKAKLLRRHGQTKLKPTANEINFLRSQASPKEERQLEDKIPKHLPIMVKIKAEKEKQFKDIDNTRWARDFELEVKNTGTKPIYRLVLLLLLPETEISGGRLVFPLHYGRTELSVFQDPLELAKPQDIPIAPGETYMFKIPEDQVGPWERLAKTEGWPQPKKIMMKFEELSFGDGTGFRWGEGIAWPQPPGWNRKAGLGGCPQGAAGTNLAGAIQEQRRNEHSSRDLKQVKFSIGGLPASYLPAKFSYALSSNSLFLGSITPELDPDDTCCSSGCSWVREYFDTTTCAGGNCGSIHRADFLLCSDSRGSCRVVDWKNRLCEVREAGYNYDHMCPYAETTACGSVPTPTPTPTPSPTPGPSASPEPTCDPATMQNDRNCHCATIAGTPWWLCFCFDGVAANYLLYPGARGSAGCDQSKTHNNGMDCCVCNVQICPDGTAPDRYSCECPTPTPMMTGGYSGGGNDNGGLYDPGCTNYYWVWFYSYDGGETWVMGNIQEYAGCW